MTKILLVGNNCPKCIVMKQYLTEEIKEGIVKVVDISSDKGKKLVSKFNVKQIPMIVEV